MSYANRECSHYPLCLDPETARRLSELGITVINASDRVILRRESTVIATVSKQSAGLISAGVALLDANTASGILTFQTRVNIDRYQTATNDYATTAKMRKMLQNGDHLGVVLLLAEKNYPYRNLRQLLGS